tara:strand:- start:539 stop:754 length:216 start_codon:yes stop_codon:yes gene_type:complete
MGLEEAKALKPAQMETLGWIVRSEEDYIVIVSTMDSSEDLVGNINAIPHSAITEIVRKPVDGCPTDFCLNA